MGIDPHGCCASYRDHVASVSISAAAMPSRKAAVADQGARDAVLGRDMDAYKRLRADGVQPSGIDGCAHLEKHADQQVQVERRNLTVKEPAA